MRKTITRFAFVVAVLSLIATIYLTDHAGDVAREAVWVRSSSEFISIDGEMAGRPRPGRELLADELALRASIFYFVSQLTMFGTIVCWGTCLVLFMLPGNKRESAYSRLKNRQDEPLDFSREEE